MLKGRFNSGFSFFVGVFVLFFPPLRRWPQVSEQLFGQRQPRRSRLVAKGEVEVKEGNAPLFGPAARVGALR